MPRWGILIDKQIPLTYAYSEEHSTHLIAAEKQIPETTASTAAALPYNIGCLKAIEATRRWVLQQKLSLFAYDGDNVSVLGEQRMLPHQVHHKAPRGKECVAHCHAAPAK